MTSSFRRDQSPAARRAEPQPVNLVIADAKAVVERDLVAAGGALEEQRALDRLSLLVRNLLFEGLGEERTPQARSALRHAVSRVVRFQAARGALRGGALVRISAGWTVSIAGTLAGGRPFEIAVGP